MEDTGKNAVRRAAGLLKLPPDLAVSLPRVSVVGCREALIENHRGVSLCESEEIRASGAVGVSVRGDGLRIASMNDRDLLIKGKIFSVEFVY